MDLSLRFSGDDRRRSGFPQYSMDFFAGQPPEGHLRRKNSRSPKAGLHFCRNAIHYRKTSGRSFMRFTVIAAVLLPAVVFAAEPSAPSAVRAETDAVAASVNGEPISVRDLLETTARQEEIIHRTLPKEERYQAVLKLRREALDRAIDRMLLLDAYRQQEFKIPEQYVESALDEIALNQGIRSRREFYARLRAQKTTPEKLRKWVREQLIVQAMTARRVQLKDPVTPKEVRAYFDAHASELGQAEQWELAMIALPADSPVRKLPGGLDKFAQGLREDPSRFAAAAALYSAGPNAADGGSLGVIPRAAVRPEFAAACRDAKPGEVRGPVAADGVDYMLKVLRIVPAEPADFAKLEPELRKKLEAENKQRIMAEYCRELRDKALIRIYQ